MNRRNTEILHATQPEAHVLPVEFGEVLNPGSLTLKRVVLSRNHLSSVADKAGEAAGTLKVLVPNNIELDPSRKQVLPRIYPVPGGGEIMAGNVVSIKVGDVNSNNNSQYARYHVVKGRYYPNGLNDGKPENDGDVSYFVIGTHGKDVVDVAELHHGQELVAGRQCRNGKFQENGIGVDVPITVSREALKFNLMSLDMGPGTLPADVVTIENVSLSHEAAVSGRFASKEHKDHLKEIIAARRYTAAMNAASIALKHT